jgi:hypothetical protein
MKASELIMAKALEYDDFRLTKIANDLNGTEQDIIVKTAAPIVAGISAAAKSLMKNNVVRNTVIGAGTGAAGGAVAAEDGNRLKGALKGAALGGAVGGIGTYGNNVRKAMDKTKDLSLWGAMKQEGNVVKDSFSQSGRAYTRSSTAAKIMDARRAAEPGDKRKLIAGQKSLAESVKEHPEALAPRPKLPQPQQSLQQQVLPPAQTEAPKQGIVAKVRGIFKGRGATATPAAAVTTPIAPNAASMLTDSRSTVAKVPYYKPDLPQPHLNYASGE